MFPLGIQNQILALPTLTGLIIVDPVTNQFVYPELLIELNKRFNHFELANYPTIIQLSTHLSILSIKPTWQTILIDPSYQTLLLDQLNNLIEIKPSQLELLMVERSILIDTQQQRLIIKLE